MASSKWLEDFSSSGSCLGFRNHDLELFHHLLCQCYHNTLLQSDLGFNDLGFKENTLPVDNFLGFGNQDLGIGKDLRNPNVKISYHFFP